MRYAVHRFNPLADPGTSSSCFSVPDGSRGAMRGF
jgi:hypothetical protein